MKTFDLEGRTTRFAKAVVKFVRSISKDAVNDRLIRQVVGASGSIGANYREANDALGKKDLKNNSQGGERGRALVGVALGGKSGQS